MEPFLERLYVEAERIFGPKRAADLKPFLEQAAQDLADLSTCRLDPEDAP